MQKNEIFYSSDDLYIFLIRLPKRMNFTCKRSAMRSYTQNDVNFGVWCNKCNIKLFRIQIKISEKISTISWNTSSPRAHLYHLLSSVPTIKHYIIWCPNTKLTLHALIKLFLYFRQHMLCNVFRSTNLFSMNISIKIAFNFSIFSFRH